MPAVDAQTPAGEKIDRYDVEITVEPSGTIRVVETIAYDFGTNSRRGIFRDVPVQLRFDDELDRVFPLNVVGVATSTNAPDQFVVEGVDGHKRIKVGDPDIFITGAHTYTITYEVEGALNGFEEHDELFWNAIGPDWAVSVGAATVTVETPSAITAVACFSGPEGSTLPCTSALSADDVATFSQTSPLRPGDGLTVVVGFEPGAVATTEPILEERWSLQRAFSLNPWTIGLSATLLVGVLLLVGWVMWTRGRDRRYVGSAVDVAFGSADGATERVPLGGGAAVPVEFLPPDGIKPGQVGTLIDEVANPLDVTATIIDLAVRGHLRIEELPEKGWLVKRPDWKLVRLESDDDLHEYERLLLESLFDDGPEVELSDLKTEFAARLKRVEDALYKDVVAQGWFTTRPDRVRTTWGAVGILVTAVGIGSLTAAAVWTRWALVPVPIVLAGLVLLIGRRFLPRRAAKGTATLRRVLGFKRFIDESEAYRARFAEEQNIFSEYLPYAVVFGATEKWAKAFEGLATETPTTGWYVSSLPFSAALFASWIDNFTVSSVGTIAARTASSGSSGWSGGGFSGVGGGVGGGGSW